MSKRVAILTGGGDVPGMNMCIKSLVYRLIDLGFDPIGVRKGWEGLIQYNPHDPTTYSDQFIELTKNIVRPIDRNPGSFLHSTRLNPQIMPRRYIPDFLRPPTDETHDLTDHIIQVVERLDYHAVIVIGDDDMLQYAAQLSDKGVPLIAIPKTIHNNIYGTDYTLGFSTGLARGVSFIHELRALAGSREQIIVIETFAAESGYSTLLIAMLAGADRVIIPEVPYSADTLAQLTLQDKRETPSNYSVVLVCDGSRLDEEQANKYADLILDGEPSTTPLTGSGMLAAQLLSHITSQEVFTQPLTYLLRTGPPDGQDLLGAANFAFLASDLVYDGKFGQMTAFVRDQMWTAVDLDQAVKGTREVDVEAMYDTEQYQPKLSLIWSLDRF